MNFKTKSYTIHEFGTRRDEAGNPHQEDCLYPSVPCDDSLAFVVCDGMGGHENGEVASAAVCEAFASDDTGEYGYSRAEFEKTLARAYRMLEERDAGGERRMGTTLTFLRLCGSGALIAHIGDSRVYHIRPGRDADSTRILHVTTDHSLVNDLVRAGELTQDEAMDFPRRNVITRAMQPGARPCRADVYLTSDIRPGDWFYLCTDGMLEQAGEENIRFIFSDECGDAARKVDILVRATAGNHDNHTAVLVNILDVSGDAEPWADAGDGQESACRSCDIPVGKGRAVDDTVAVAGHRGKSSESTEAARKRPDGRLSGSPSVARLEARVQQERNKRRVMRHMFIVVMAAISVMAAGLWWFMLRDSTSHDAEADIGTVMERSENPVPEPVVSGRDNPAPMRSAGETVRRTGEAPASAAPAGSPEEHPASPAEPRIQESPDTPDEPAVSIAGPRAESVSSESRPSDGKPDEEARSITSKGEGKTP